MRSKEAIRDKLRGVREHREDLEDNTMAQIAEDLGGGLSASAKQEADAWIDCLEWVLEDGDDDA